ncbi:DUF6064 family protein [Hydrogenophaga sp.]|uniref:DUF6064 family protein n=1 Tax=Hydrogenophaga sp. TaxID=1904254 RepID=UPI003F724668
MSEWWTYRPSDLLMFAPRTWWRLFELHNEALWPLHLLTSLVALTLAVALWRGQPGALRAGLALLAACWALVAWAFLWRRYAPIFSAADAFAVGFALQAAILVLLGVRRGTQLSNHDAIKTTGLALLAWAVLVHPWLAVISSRPWLQAEAFGVAPDPTAIGTLGVVLCLTSQDRMARVLLGLAWLIAVLWCAISAATLWTMGSLQGWVPALAAGLALTALARRRA